MKSKCVVFDLDDTLVYELDFLKSAYKEIAHKVNPANYVKLYDKMMIWYIQKLDVFNCIIQEYPRFTKEYLLSLYRNHFPEIKLNIGAEEVFTFCKSRNYRLGLITDGRSVTQRNKLKALKIEGVFDKIIISEEFGFSKPDPKVFEEFSYIGIKEYFYIADNPEKDFVSPNMLNWETIALKDKGFNIHVQDFNVDFRFKPKYVVQELKEVINYIK
jgi:putative hydrolase of the HAD superfamily